MLKCETKNGETRLELEWRDQSIRVYTYLCESSGSLAEEISRRGVSPDKPVALLPLSMVESPLQLIQGAIHYAMHAPRINRIKNRGLLLASLITGVTQLSELVESLERELRGRGNFYLISVDAPPCNTDKCVPIALRFNEDMYSEKLIKNVKCILSMI
ncbi:MAG: hypothetical protein QXK88_04100 [Desulfurococcaceae archaeon]